MRFRVKKEVQFEIQPPMGSMQTQRKFWYTKPNFTPWPTRLPMEIYWLHAEVSAKVFVGLRTHSLKASHDQNKASCTNFMQNFKGGTSHTPSWTLHDAYLASARSYDQKTKKSHTSQIKSAKHPHSLLKSIEALHANGVCANLQIWAQIDRTRRHMKMGN